MFMNMHYLVTIVTLSMKTYYIITGLFSLYGNSSCYYTYSISLSGLDPICCMFKYCLSIQGDIFKSLVLSNFSIKIERFNNRYKTSKCLACLAEEFGEMMIDGRP